MVKEDKLIKIKKRHHKLSYSHIWTTAGVFSFNLQFVKLPQIIFGKAFTANTEHFSFLLG